ncbi:hypothetical protein [Rhizobium sp. L51/94]|uniref:hypothetical protein n=1 Tax=Rhizobium sp. L51/94 TaxID=2819999 RepID=UPI001C5B3302|nr:hypothetical protein [Rhizobium sp. L51/94]QXZ79641.1 hypothetical protein J5274_06570 [Rhizobium sp. L51/94]
METIILGRWIWPLFGTALMFGLVIVCPPSGKSLSFRDRVMIACAAVALLFFLMTWALVHR